MSRRAASFTQADVARALRAAEQVAPGRYRVRLSRQGEIVLEPAGDADVSAPPPDTSAEKPVALLREPRL